MVGQPWRSPRSAPLPLPKRSFTVARLEPSLKVNSLAGSSASGSCRGAGGSRPPAVTHACRRTSSSAALHSRFHACALGLMPGLRHAFNTLRGLRGTAAGHRAAVHAAMASEPMASLPAPAHALVLGEEEPTPAFPTRQKLDSGGLTAWPGLAAGWRAAAPRRAG
jgi:hypothetical protein